MKHISILVIAFIVSLTSCSKSSGPGNTGHPPSNLVLTATVNPDSSGNVSFTASATDAVNFEYNFGNSIIQTVPTGIVTYKYAASGNYVVTVTAKSADGSTVSTTTSITVNLPLTLFWSEEFNTDGPPDPAKWGYDIGNNGGWGNAELEYYTNRPENAVVQGGVLKINAIKESYSGSAYTSARLLSQNKFAFTFGKVLVRAKLPAGVGTWPAIWMLGSNINTVSWPSCGEIDIMEHLGRDLNKIYGTLHYPGRSGGNADGGTLMISNATTAFHIYRLDWTPSIIQIYVDDQLVHTVTNSGSIPFNHDFFFILNVAMGGNFGGPVDPAFTAATMEVDYVRVFK